MFGLFRKNAAPKEPAAQERSAVAAAELPQWFAAAFADRLAHEQREQGERMQEIGGAVERLRSALAALAAVEFAKGEKAYAAANMAKDALVKRAESALFGAAGLRACKEVLAGFRAVPQKQIVLVTHYFVKEGGAVVAAVRGLEGAVGRAERFQEGSLLKVQERVAAAAAELGRKEEQLRFINGKLEELEREERQAAGAKQAAEAELNAVLQGAEWKAWEAADAAWGREVAAQRAAKEEWLGQLRQAERAFRKAEHAGALAEGDAEKLRAWFAGERPGDDVAEVLERLAAVAEEPERVQRVASSRAWEVAWDEPARPAALEKGHLEQRVAAARAQVERVAVEQERLRADRAKLRDEVHDRVVDIEDLVLKGTGRAVAVQAL